MDQLFPPPPLPSTPWSVLLDRLGNSVLDSLASLFSLPVPPNVNQDVRVHTIFDLLSNHVFGILDY